MAVSDYSTTPADNTSISGLTVTDATLASALDNIIRQLMADIKSFYDDAAFSASTQPLDAALTSIAALGTAANKGIYTTGVDTFAEFDLTAAGRALLDDADAAAQRSTLGLGNIATTNLIDEDDMASDTAAQAPTQQSVKAYVDASVGTGQFTSSFESLNIAWTSNDYIDLGAHGLGSVPTLIRVWASCKSAINGYSVGDIIDLSAGQWNAGSNAYGVQAMASATNLYLRTGANGILYLDKGTSTSNFGLSTGQWDLNVRAYA